MRISYINIKNFRGISEAHIHLAGHSVIIGDNNAGKSTIFEAMDLVLGPERLNRLPVVDEHDFYNGVYYLKDAVSPQIEIEVLVTGLGAEQLIRFKNNLEFWDLKSLKLLELGEIDSTDVKSVVEALRVKFIGKYSPEEDDFEGETFFCWPKREDEQLARFSKPDKRQCGFLYLRALRTGARALSMERGSLLDIILRIREIRPKMWEDILDQLRETDVATDPALGIKNILEGVQGALKEFVPADWGTEPLLRVSDLTREHLRKTLTIFMSTGKGTYHAPFQHQGTGTINTIVLALLTMIAEAKQNVIFAMEEPEIAIPPYTQKRIVDSIRRKSTQAIFTSHSPFVLEEFSPDQIILVQRSNKGVVDSKPVHFPATIKPKSYNSEFRMRFAEALLAKRILLTEGLTEATAYSAAGRKLNELAASKYSSLEAMGVAIFNVMSETAIADFGLYFRSLGKMVLAVFDKQDTVKLKEIKDAIDYPFESSHKGFENLIVEETNEEIITKYVDGLIDNGDWPTALDKYNPSFQAFEAYQLALKKYLIKTKGAGTAADLLGTCTKTAEMPATIRNILKKIKELLE